MFDSVSNLMGGGTEALWLEFNEFLGDRATYRGS